MTTDTKRSLLRDWIKILQSELKKSLHICIKNFNEVLSNLPELGEGELASTEELRMKERDQVLIIIDSHWLKSPERV